MGRSFLFCMAAASCSLLPMKTDAATPPPDINDVLRAHEKELLALPEVRGVYVGLCSEKCEELCLHVMLARESAAARQALPKSLGGYLLVAEVTGDIRPVRGGK